MMFLGMTSWRSSGGSCCRRQRLRMAIATARLAASCPTIYLSSSAKIWRGVISATETSTFSGQSTASARRGLAAKQSQLLYLDIPIRINAQIRRDLQGFADDVGGGQVGVNHQGAGGGLGVGAAGADGGDAVGRLDDVAGAAD